MSCYTLAIFLYPPFVIGDTFYVGEHPKSVTYYLNSPLNN
jgi:hypothetical protein